MHILTTPRLRLRTWRPEDVAPFYHMNQDPAVIEYLKGPMTLQQVAAFVEHVNAHQAQFGYSLWAVETLTDSEFLGFVGLHHTDWPAHFTPATEIGWRLKSAAWGQGFATEAATAVLAFGFNQCHLDEIVSLTMVANQRSRRVMEKIGLHTDPADDFDHPNLPSDHPGLRHVLYRLTHSEYLSVVSAV